MAEVRDDEFFRAWGGTGRKHKQLPEDGWGEKMAENNGAKKGAPKGK